MLEQPGFLYSAAAFLVLFTPLVFVHEFGHFWVARRCGVKVDIFSIGFGPTLMKWCDRQGTEWRLSAVPLGGYVKFHGDADGSSRPDTKALADFSEEDRKISFPHKPLYQRAAIVAAGPLANLLFASLIFAMIFIFAGRVMVPATIDKVMPESAAESAGLQPGDGILAIDGETISRFQELQEKVLLNVGEPMHLKILRDQTEVEVHVTPRLQDHTDAFGKTQKIRMLGVTPRGTEGAVRQPLAPLRAIAAGFAETGHYMVQTLKVVSQMIVGSRSLRDMGGPLKIGEVSGQAASISLLALISLAAILSVNLGLINLFPVPMLDGGHLLYYAFEAIFRRPLGERVQEYGFRIGLVAVLSLMLFVTWNDLVGLGVADGVANFFSGLFS